MQFVNNQFVVLTVDPEIKIKVKKWVATENGEPVIRQSEKDYQQGTATDNTEWNGQKTIFTFDAEPGTVEAGDTISGDIDHQQPTHIKNVVVERGKGSLAPKKFTPKPLPKFDPNASDPDVAYDAPQGVEPTFADLTDIVRKLQRRVHALESKFV